jgi:glycosyltransferase involved in cell wall biosynthesis
MREICGDIGEDNVLTKREKLTYLLQNFLRGVTSWSLPGKVKGWKGKVVPNGSDSPGRLYVDTYLRQELPRLVLPGKIRVLDIGCGTGYVHTLLSELGYSGEYVGLDVVQEPAFAKESETFSVSFVQGQIEAFETNEPFDLVISNTTLEHVQDDRTAAQVALRVLAPDGVGVHIVPSYWSLFLYLWHGYRQYTPKMLRRMFKGQNYTLIGLGGIGSFFVHLFGITLPERVFGFKSLRKGGIYPRLLSFGLFLDRILPACRALSVVVVHPHKDQRTKVLFALPSLLVGGIEQQLTEQLKRYDRERFSLTLVTLFEYEGRESFKDKLPSDVRFESIALLSPFDWSGWKRLIQVLRNVSPDVVVSSMFSANTALRLLKPFFHYQVIAREHNIYDEKTFIQRTVDRLLAKVTCRIIAVSKDVARFASKQAGIPSDKFTVIQNGVDIKKLQAWQNTQSDKKTLKAQLGFHEDDQLILTVGRLKKVKNHEALIRAFTDFSKEFPKYRLVIIGSGVEKPELQELVREIPHERAVLLERYGEAVWPYYAAADWFILPSLREGFPNVILEAMAFGLPIMATNISGSNECVEDALNGLIIPSTASGIKGSLVRAAKLSETELEAMSKASLIRVEQFSIEETVRKYEDTFNQCRI